MRAAQISGDGSLYDADGAVYGQGEARPRPARPARLSGPSAVRPSLRGVSRAPARLNAIRFSGLGQAPKGDLELRNLAEMTSGDHGPRPVSQFKITRKFTGNALTEIYAGRVVYPLNSPLPLVYFVSARPAADDMIKLMRIEGTSGYWEEIALADFNKNFMVADPGVEFQIVRKFTIITPIIDGKDASERTTVGWAHTNLSLSIRNMIQEGLFRVQMADPKVRADALPNFEATVVTSLQLAIEGLDMAAAGLDTFTIGYNTFQPLLSVAVNIITRLKQIGLLLLQASQTGSDELYVKIGAMTEDFCLSQSALWGAVLTRATIWEALTLSTQFSMGTLFYDRLYSKLTPLTQQLYRDRDNIIAGSGVDAASFDQLKTDLAGYIREYPAGRNSMNDDVAKLLGDLGLSRAELDISPGALAEMLSANADVIEALKNPPKLAPILTPQVYSFLGAVLPVDILAAPAGGKGVIPPELKDMRDVNRAVMQEKREAFLKGDNVVQTAMRQRFQEAVGKRGFGAVINEVYGWADDLMAKLGVKNPEEAKAIMDAQKWKDVQAQLGASANPREQSMGRYMAEVATSRAPTQAEYAWKALRSAEKIAEQVLTDPLGAYEESFRFYTEEMRPEAMRGKVENLVGAYARWAYSGDAPPEQAAGLFRARLYQDVGLSGFEARDNKTFEDLGKEVDSIRDKVKTGNELVPDPQPGNPDNMKVEKIGAASLQNLRDDLVELEKFYKAYGEDRQGSFETLQRNRKIKGQAIAELIRQAEAEGSGVPKDIAAIVAFFNDVDRLVDKYGKQYDVANAEGGPNLLDITGYTPFKTGGVLNNSELAEVDNISKISQDIATNIKKLKELMKDKEGQARNPKQVNVLYNDTVALADQVEPLIRKYKDRKNARERLIKKTKVVLTWMGRILGAGYVGPKALKDWLYKDNKRVTAFLVGIINVPIYIAWTFGTIVVLNKILGFLAPSFDAAKDVHNLLSILINFVRGITAKISPDVRETRPKDYWDAPVQGEAAPGSVTWWEIGLYGLVIGFLIAPGRVITGFGNVFKGITKGIGTVVRGRPGPGRPGFGKKKPLAGPGRPPDVEKIVKEYERARDNHDPVGVKKALDKLKRAKDLGLPGVPAGLVGLRGLLGLR